MSVPGGSSLAGAFVRRAGDAMIGDLGLQAATVATVAPAAAVPGTLYKDGLLSALVTFTYDGTPAIVKDVNVSSLTDSGVGDVEINLATDLDNDDYVPIATLVEVGASASIVTVNARSVSSLGLVVRDTSGNPSDVADAINVAVFGGLA